MKTVSGKIVSSKTIPLSQASRILEDFVSDDNGASQALSVFLKRSSNSFNELVELHRELKGERLRREREKDEFVKLENGDVKYIEENPRGVRMAFKKEEDEEEEKIGDLGQRQSLGYAGSRGVDGNDGESIEKKKVKKAKMKGEYQVEVKEEKSEERKKRVKVEVEDGSVGGSEERHSRKKKKRRHGEEN